MLSTSSGAVPGGTVTGMPPPAGPSGRSGRVVRAVTLVVAVGGVAAAFGADLLPDAEPGFGTAQTLILGLGIFAGVLLFLPVRYAQRFLVVLAATAVSVVLAEVALRIFLADTFSTLFEFNPHYIYRNAPNARKKYTHHPANGSGSVLTRINSEGFRGPELREGGGKRIAVYGDSFILGRFSELEATFPARLEARLRKTTPDVEVVNAAVVGYGPDQAGLKMEDELPRLRPDIVVLSICGNDFGDLLRNKLFKLNDDGTLHENALHLSDSVKEDLHGTSDPYLLRAFKRFLRGLEPPKRKLLDEELKTCRREYTSYVLDGNNETQVLFEDHTDSDLRVEPRGDSALYKKRFMTSVLRRIRETLAERGTPLVLLLIPTAVDACDDYEGRHVDPAKYPEYRRSALTDAMAEAAKDAGIPCVDLFPVFRTRDANTLYLHGGDDHWNDAGEDLAAEQMADYLLSHGLIHRPARRAGITSRSVR